MPDVPTVTLNSGHAMPQLGFGVFQIPNDETETRCQHRVRGRLPLDRHRRDVPERAGRRRGDRASGIPRDELFITTKLNNNAHGYDAGRAACRESLDKLGLDYLDLYLIHWPLPAKDQYVETWQALISLRDEGLIRSIGVSNFQPAHLDRIVDETGVTPALNQIELHPYLTQARAARVRHRATASPPRRGRRSRRAASCSTTR